MTQHAQVSFESEKLILVDSDDNVVGFESKGRAHDGEGMLHRAFSVFLFNEDGEVLLQKRSAEKRLWPLYWSNSCCSHPREGESYEVATARRIKEELSVEAELIYLYRFQYQARFSAEAGSEHELCSVYVGRVDDPDRVDVHPKEIAEWAWLSPEEVDRMIAERPDELTPWFKMEWQRLRNDYRETVESLAGRQ